MIDQVLFSVCVIWDIAIFGCCVIERAAECFSLKKISCSFFKCHRISQGLDQVLKIKTDFAI